MYEYTLNLALSEKSLPIKLFRTGVCMHGSLSRVADADARPEFFFNF